MAASSLRDKPRRLRRRTRSVACGLAAEFGSRHDGRCPKAIVCGRPPETRDHSFCSPGHLAERVRVSGLLMQRIRRRWCTMPSRNPASIRRTAVSGSIPGRPPLAQWQSAGPGTPSTHARMWSSGTSRSSDPATNSPRLGRPFALQRVVALTVPATRHVPRIAERRHFSTAPTH